MLTHCSPFSIHFATITTGWFQGSCVSPACSFLWNLDSGGVGSWGRWSTVPSSTSSKLGRFGLPGGSGLALERQDPARSLLEKEEDEEEEEDDEGRLPVGDTPGVSGGNDERRRQARPEEGGLVDQERASCLAVKLPMGDKFV
jgi:hypothetical protein